MIKEAYLHGKRDLIHMAERLDAEGAASADVDRCVCMYHMYIHTHIPRYICLSIYALYKYDMRMPYLCTPSHTCLIYARP